MMKEKRGIVISKTPGYSYLSLLYSPLSALTQGCIVVMRFIRLCIISLLATLPLAVHASPQPLEQIKL
ncbi:hypothetical protein ACEQ9C_17250, partial [Klebsiella pneumoniae]